MTDRESLFPVFLKLAGRRVLVVGGGPVAASKLAALARGRRRRARRRAGRRAGDCRARRARSRGAPFVAADLDDAWFVVAAATPEVNRQVADAAESRRVFVNAVDDLASASAYLGGVVRKGGVTLAISTDGRAPALAGLLREGLEAVLPGRPRGLARRPRRPLAGTGCAAACRCRARRPLLLQAINRLYEPVAGRRGAGRHEPPRLDTCRWWAPGPGTRSC